MEVTLISSNESSEVRKINTQFCILKTVDGEIYIDENHSEGDFIIINGSIKFDKETLEINHGYCFLKNKNLNVYYI